MAKNIHRRLRFRPEARQLIKHCLVSAVGIPALHFQPKAAGTIIFQAFKFGNLREIRIRKVKNIPEHKVLLEILPFESIWATTTDVSGGLAAIHLSS